MNIDRMRELAGLSEDDTREVTVPGYGVLQRDQLINSAMRNVDDLVDMAKRGNWEGVMYALKDGVLETKVQTLIDTQEEDE